MRQFQAYDRILPGRVDPHRGHGAVQVSRRVGNVEVGIGVQEGLDRVGSGFELAQGFEREERRMGVEHGRVVRREVGDIPAEQR